MGFGSPTVVGSGDQALHHGLSQAGPLVGQRIASNKPCVVHVTAASAHRSVGVHWPSDVIADWAFGSAVLLTSALILWWPLARGWTARDVAPNPTAPT